MCLVVAVVAVVVDVVVVVVVIVRMVAALVVALAEIASDGSPRKHRDVSHHEIVPIRERSHPVEVPANPSPEIRQHGCYVRRRIWIPPAIGWVISRHHHIHDGVDHPDYYRHKPHNLFHRFLHSVVIPVGTTVSEF